MKRTFVIGDIHGRYKALMQVLSLVNFNYDIDLLIFLGDVLDRGEEPFECIKELLKIKNKILIRGNHDENFFQFTQSGHDGFNGHHGVYITKTKWREADEETRQMVLQFFHSQRPYYVDEHKRMFTHGGFNKMERLDSQPEHMFAWDRGLFEQAMSCSEGQTLKTIEKFKRVFIGHTPTQIWDINEPIFAGNLIWNLDTGSGFSKGKLSIMNVDTEEFWQSDYIYNLYPDLKGI